MEALKNCCEWCEAIKIINCGLKILKWWQIYAVWSFLWDFKWDFAGNLRFVL